jgi:leucyl/phenylalanyl-tRNA--protein transferase
MSLDLNELLHAYTRGYFPMSVPEEDNQVFWFKPEMRGIIPLDNYQIPRNLKRLYRKQPFEMKINSDFSQTIRSCANRSDTWISEEIIEAYEKLHDMGFAYSFEAWEEKVLVGGLYGLAIGNAFFGESMFHLKSNASKLALVFLFEFLKERDFSLLDTQYINIGLLAQASIHFGGVFGEQLGVFGAR